MLRTNTNNATTSIKKEKNWITMLINSGEKNEEYPIWGHQKNKKKKNIDGGN